LLTPNLPLSVIKDHHTKISLSENDTSSYDFNFSLHDSLDTESSDDKINNDKINIEKEQYYAVMYDITWYTGRVIEKYQNNMYSIKFLKGE